MRERRDYFNIALDQQDAGAMAKEERLMVAVLEEAINDYLASHPYPRTEQWREARKPNIRWDHDHRERCKARTREEVGRWIFDDPVCDKDANYLYSLTSICAHLGRPIERYRQHVRNLDQVRAQEIAEGKRYFKMVECQSCGRMMPKGNGRRLCHLCWSKTKEQR